MSKALPGENYCKGHQGNHSHYDPKNCTVCRLQLQLDAALVRANEAEADALRYRYIRDNQYWQRREPRYDDPGFDLIGVKFEKDNGFTARIYLDHAIDQRIKAARREG